jgi:GGDEF domain-containing protein
MISLKKIFSWPESAPAEADPPEFRADSPAHLEGGADNLSGALLQALRMLVEGLALDSAGLKQGETESKRAALLHRLEGELLPFDVLEIASDALTAQEEYARASQNHDPIEEHTQPAADGDGELARAALQGLKTLIEGLPVSDQDSGGCSAAVADLLGRLDGPVVPFDVLEIAGDAVTLVEQEAKTVREQRRREDDQRQIAEQRSQLAGASLQGLQMLLGMIGGFGADTPARRTIRELARRIESTSVPADVLAIANEARTVVEQDLKAVRHRQEAAEEERRLLDEGAELAGALRRALQMLLGGVPLASATAGVPEASSRRALDELQRRLERANSPAEILEIASQSLAALQHDFETTQDLYGEQEQQREWAGRQVALTNAFVDSLQLLLAGLAELSVEAGEPGVTAEHALKELLKRLEAPLTPVEVLAIAQEALAVVRLDFRAAKDRELSGENQAPVEDQSQDLAKTLLQALRILVGNWPMPSGRAGEDRKHVVEDLLRRLQEPLSPFDILEIASDALSAFEQEAKAAAESQERDGREVAARQSDLLSGYLQALRMLIVGLPAYRESRAMAALDARGASLSANLLRRLDDLPPAGEVLDIAKEVVATVQEDNKAILNRLQVERRERQAMIAMLSDAVAALAASKTNSVAWLRQIEQRIDQAETLEDLRTSGLTLSDCLQALLQTSRVARPSSAERATALERRPAAGTIALAPAWKTPSDEDTDNTEGIPQQAAPAEYAVVFVMDREDAIANRFGESVRNRALRHVQQHLKNGLMPSDRLVRWKGAAFVASIKRTASLPEVRSELRNLGCISVPPLVEVGNRSIRLPISLSWAVFPHSRFASVDQLFEKVDEFLARTQPGKGK